MGSKSQPAPPPAPDPYKIADAEAQYNRINQYTPYGSLTFTDPSQGQRASANLELSPEIQNLFDLQLQSDTNLLGQALNAQGGIADLVKSPLNVQGLPNLRNEQTRLQGLDLSGLPQLGTDVGAIRNDAEKAFFDRSSSLLNEQFGQQEDRLRQTLANQGLQAGSEAFGEQFGEFNRRRGDTFENLARDAVIFGGSEASRALQDQLALRGTAFGEELTGAGFENQRAQQILQNRSGVRSQLLNEQQWTRANQFNELASLLGIQQVAQTGLQNFFAPSGVNTLGAFGLNQAAQQNSFNQRSASSRAAKGEFGDLLQTVIGIV